MIILKILLITLLAVLGIILGVILLVLILPVRAEVSFIGGKLKYKFKLSAVPVLTSEGGGLLNWWKNRKKKAKKPKKPKPAKDKKEKKSKEKDKKKKHDAPSPFAEDTASYEDISFTDDMTDISPAEEKKKKKKKHIEEGEEYEFTFESLDDDPFEDDDDDDEEETNKKTLGEKVEFVLDLWEHAGRPLGKILKGFHFKDVYIDFVTANEDAYKCALLYGRVSAIVYNLLAWMSTVFTVRLKTIDVNAGFSVSKSQWDAAFRLSFRAYHAVIAGLWFLITYSFKVFLPNKIKSRKAKKKKA